jgi:hypothetical protein
MMLPIQITNIGKVVAQFRLVPKLDEVCPTNYANRRHSIELHSLWLTLLLLEYTMQALDDSFTDIWNANSG